MPSILHVGVGRATITPPIGVDLMGYSRRSRPSTGIHMDMFATALVATANGKTVAILDCDLTYLHPPLVDEIRDAIAGYLGTQRSHVLVNCTHSHSAPTSSPVKIGGEQDRVRPEEDAYIRSLPHLLLSAVMQANTTKRPARIAAGHGRIEFSTNRREKLADGRTVLGINHNGPVDHAVGVVRIDSMDGRPLAAVVNFTCHPIFAGSASRLISPDFPGPMRRTVERETGASCLFLQGSTGNINPKNPMHADVAEAERVGTMLGLEAAKIFLDIETRTMVQQEHWLTSVATFHLVRKEPVDTPIPGLVAGVEEVLSVPLKKLPDLAEAKHLLQERREALEALIDGKADVDDQNPAKYQVMWAEQLVRTIEQKLGPSHVRVPVQAIRINDVGFVGVAGELFVEIQLAIKKGSPFQPTFVAAYSNGCVGYLPVADAYPDGGYEVDHSYKGYRLPAAIAPGAAERVADTAVKLLHALANT